jgi:hypothetical protein
LDAQLPLASLHCKHGSHTSLENGSEIISQSSCESWDCAQGNAAQYEQQKKNNQASKQQSSERPNAA